MVADVEIIQDGALVGWGAVGGALVGGGFGADAVSVWDKINDTKADIQKVESTVQEAIDQRISTQETRLQRIAQELGLDKPKQ